MKKLIGLLLTLTCVFALAGCAVGSSALKGTIKESTYEGTAFVMRSGLKTYGFVITEDTQIIWDDGQPKDTRRTTYYACLKAIVIPGEETEQPEFDTWLYGDSMNADKWMYAKEVTFVPDESGKIATVAKPVIYFYPETETDVTVHLDYDGELTCTYPAYNHGWTVTAQPDGTLTDEAGQTYNYLYWEGLTDGEYDFSQGFCVAGADTAPFLEDALAKLGLTRREANEFIVYWLPLMQDNAYNLISFQEEAYTSHAALTVSPAPDTMIRVFMAWTPLSEMVEIEPQVLTTPEREGFTVVEWGGSQIAP